ncbi:band 7 protein AGAP004871 [Tetranychus urticae]|uniref:Band 7 domain-containing protein n=1 Tax=Tetranychus urticae TaxID=32264 RepID=T1KJA4_TETUR|nr:band 7 protein AGAP004871 [Tetranychus urticae]
MTLIQVESNDRTIGYHHNESQVKDRPFVSFVLLSLSIFLIIALLPLSLLFVVEIIKEYERAVVFRLGRLKKGGVEGPGVHVLIPCIDTLSKVDLRTITFDVPPQEILTSDSVTVSVDAVVYFRICNPIFAVTNVQDYRRSTQLLAATTLRNVLGGKSLSQLLSELDTISQILKSNLDTTTESWGVKVERVEIKDIRLPTQLQRAMAAEAEAMREARAKVIASEGEQKASRALRAASEIMVESPAALQLRYLQTLNTIAAEKTSTIIYPIPIDMFSAYIDFQEKDKVTNPKASSSTLPTLSSSTVATTVIASDGEPSSSS